MWCGYREACGHQISHDSSPELQLKAEKCVVHVLLTHPCCYFSFTGEAIHLGSLIAAQGYVFPISDHVLTLKDDGTFYRFQVGEHPDSLVGPSSVPAVILLKSPTLYT